MDILAVLICASLFSGSGWLFWKGVTDSVKPSGAEIIGSITYKNKVAQRKYSDRAVWESVGVNASLYSRDSIRTASGSSAILKLNNGAEILLDENTLILLDYDSQKRNIEFLYGNIHTSGTETAQALGSDASMTKAEPMTISALGSKISLGKGQASLGVSEKGKLDLTVTQGSVELAVEGKKQEIRENQKAEVLPGAKTASVAAIPIQLTSPAREERRILFTDEGPVDFAWRSEEPTQDFLLEVSSSANFAAIAASTLVRDKSARLNLKAGTWFARVGPGGESGASGAISEPIRFHLILQQAPRGLTPTDGRQFSYRTQTPSIRFSWRPVELASSYILEISDSKEFERVVQSQVSSYESLNIEGLAEGSYWWRVKPVFTVGGSSNSIASTVMGFSMVRVAELQAAEAVLPLDGELIYEKAFKESGIRFAWKFGPETASSTLVIFSKGNQDSPALRLDSPSTSIVVSTGLKAGDYLWQIHSLAADGSSGPPSAMRSFIISDKLPQISLSSPEDGAEQDAASALRFAWECDSAQPFRLEISSNQSFSSPSFKETASYTSDYRMDTPGIYYWRVSALDAKGMALSSSASRKLEILKPLSPPALSQPKPGSAIELVNAPALEFAWIASEGAQSYSLRLLDAQGNLILEKSGLSSPGYKMEDLSRLGVGAYRLELSSQASGRSGSRSSPKAIGEFSLARMVRTKPPELLEPPNDAQIDELEIKRSGLNLSWKAETPLNQVRLILAKDPGFRQIMSETTVEGNQTKLRRLEPGSYYWVVSGTAEDGKSYSSTVRQFEVKRAPPLATPQVNQPRSGESIDMSIRDSIVFGWKAVPEASYYSIKLVSRKSGAVVAALESFRGTRWEFSDLPKLDIGGFAFSLQAVSVDSAGAVERRSATTTVDFSIRLSQDGSASEFLSPDTIYLP